MRLRLSENKDFLSGLMFVVIGLGAIFVARDYPIGSTLRMGPGYFPVALGGILFLMGVYVLVQGIVVKKERVEGGWSLRALIVLPAATIAFGWLLDNLGFVPALVALLFGSALAGKEFKLREVALLTVLLTVCCTIVFIYGLGMPYPLFTRS